MHLHQLRCLAPLEFIRMRNSHSVFLFYFTSCLSFLALLSYEAPLPLKKKKKKKHANAYQPKEDTFKSSYTTATTTAVHGCFFRFSFLRTLTVVLHLFYIFIFVVALFYLSLFPQQGLFEVRNAACVVKKTMRSSRCCLVMFLCFFFFSAAARLDMHSVFSDVAH